MKNVSIVIYESCLNLQSRVRILSPYPFVCPCLHLSNYSTIHDVFPQKYTISWPNIYMCGSFSKNGPIWGRLFSKKISICVSSYVA